MAYNGQFLVGLVSVALSIHALRCAWPPGFPPFLHCAPCFAPAVGHARSRQAGPGSEWKRGNLILSQLASTYRSSTRCPAQRVGSSVVRGRWLGVRRGWAPRAPGVAWGGAVGCMCQ